MPTSNRPSRICSGECQVHGEGSPKGRQGIRGSADDVKDTDLKAFAQKTHAVVKVLRCFQWNKNEFCKPNLRTLRSAAAPIPQGRLIIAQRFIAGKRAEGPSQSRQGRQKSPFQLHFFRPWRDLGPHAARHPPINRWAIFFRPPGWTPQFHRKQRGA